MKFDSPFMTRLNWIADWVLRIILTNVLVVLFSLPIVTIYPAMLAGYGVFASYYDRQEGATLRVFWRGFRTKFWARLGFSTGLILLSYLSVSNLMYYSDLALESWFYRLGYYVTLLLLAVGYALVLYAVVVHHVRSELRLKAVVPLALHLSGRFAWITALLVMLNLIPLLMLMIQATGVLFVFSGVSIPLLLHAWLTRGVRVLLNKGESQ